jgi:hypothetical protein
MREGNEGQSTDAGDKLPCGGAVVATRIKASQSAFNERPPDRASQSHDSSANLPAKTRLPMLNAAIFGSSVAVQIPSFFAAHFHNPCDNRDGRYYQR